MIIEIVTTQSNSHVSFDYCLITWHTVIYMADSEETCTIEWLDPTINAMITKEDRCQVAREVCDYEAVFNIYSVYYCDFNANFWLFFPVALMIVLLTFYYLSYVADEHLSPGLVSLAKTFKLSESLAGVTLIAFGLSAPDIAASLSAARGGSAEDIQLGVDLLLGASFVTSTAVVAIAILAARQPTAMNKKFHLRDCSALFFAYILLLYTQVFLQEIDFYVSIAFLVLYMAYVVAVLITDKI